MGHAEVLHENGIETHSRVSIITKCTIMLTKFEEYFKPSTTKARSFLERVNERILSKHFNSDEMLPNKDIQATIVSKYFNMYLVQRMRRFLSDFWNARKGQGHLLNSKQWDMTGSFLVIQG